MIRGRAATDVSIITSAHDVADARLHRLTAAFVRAGLSVEVLALGDVADAPAGAAAIRTWPRGGPVHRAWLALSLPWRAGGAVLVTLDPDVLLTAWFARPLRRRRLVADVHEDYRALVVDRPWSRPRRAVAASVAALAGAAARRSDLTVVVDDHVPPLTARHRIVVRNLPDPRMLPAASVARSTEPRAVYVGDIRDSRGLNQMLDVLAASPAWTLDLVGPVAPADRAALTDRLAADTELAARVRLHGRMPPAESWQVASGAWVGFCLLAPTPAFTAATASKLYEYLAVGVVPVVSDLPRQREFVERSGSGYVVDDAAAAATVLAKVLDNPETLDEQVARGRAWLTSATDGSAYEDLAVTVRDLRHG